MIKYNQELSHLISKRVKLENSINHCSCWYGGIGEGGFVRQPCTKCEEEQKKLSIVLKRISKLDDEINQE